MSDLPNNTEYIHGISNRNLDNTATVTASTVHGIRDNLSTVNFNRRNAGGSRSNPARIRITTNAIRLKIGMN